MNALIFGFVILLIRIGKSENLPRFVYRDYHLRPQHKGLTSTMPTLPICDHVPATPHLLGFINIDESHSRKARCSPVQSNVLLAARFVPVRLRINSKLSVHWTG